MFNVTYFNTKTGNKVYRNYRFMEIEQVRKLSTSYAKRHSMQVVAIKKVY